jgi:hypothetical protein
LVRKWYKVPIDQNPVIPPAEQKITIDQLIKHVEEVSSFSIENPFDFLMLFQDCELKLN